MAEPVRESNAWRRLEWHHAEIRELHLRDLFESDPTRGERLTGEVAGLYLDYSKHRVVDDTLKLLRRLADERDLVGQVHAMFRGEPVNVSEGRPALHVALRMSRSRSLLVAGVDVVEQVHEQLDRFTAFAERVRSGEWRGATGERIRAVVNIGIGGSDLGPAMAYEALAPFATADVDVRFVANVDPAALAGATRDLRPEETLVVVVSKTMTTLETAENAAAARAWIAAAVGDDVSAHFAAVTASPDAAAGSGAAPETVFTFWDWVGGRTSLCSAVGLSLAIAVGDAGFRALLDGFRAVDEHFLRAPLGGNVPAVAGLLDVWYRGFFGTESIAVFPYSSRLSLLPSYLQQLAMESLGKGVTREGEPVDVDTGAIVWGSEATPAQHAVFQLLHQGTVLVPTDLVGVAGPALDDPRHDLLTANLLAQAEALAFGRTEDELLDAGAREETIPHRVMPGNRPTSVVLLDELTPATLGALIAFWEHRVFTQAAVWGIDPFDQWGVELGKELAARIAPELARDWKRELLHDSSTNALVRRYRSLRHGR